MKIDWSMVAAFVLGGVILDVLMKVFLNSVIAQLPEVGSN